MSASQAVANIFSTKFSKVFERKEKSYFKHKQLKKNFFSPKFEHWKSIFNMLGTKKDYFKHKELKKEQIIYFSSLSRVEKVFFNEDKMLGINVNVLREFVSRQERGPLFFFFYCGLSLKSSCISIC